MPPLRGCSPMNDVNCTDVFCCDPTPITATQSVCLYVCNVNNVYISYVYNMHIINVNIYII